MKRLAGIGASIASWSKASRASEAAMALAGAKDVKRLVSIGASIVSSVEAFDVFSASASVVRTAKPIRPPMASRLPHESAAGFSPLSHVSHVVRTKESFPRQVGELIAQEFGDVNTTELDDAADEHDEAAIRAGFNPTLKAFPRASYEKVLLAAGFRLSFPSVPVPQAIEEPDVAPRLTHSIGKFFVNWNSDCASWWNKA